MEWTYHVITKHTKQLDYFVQLEDDIFNKNEIRINKISCGYQHNIILSKYAKEEKTEEPHAQKTVRFMVIKQ